MRWDLVIFAAVLLLVGALILMNADAVARSIYDAQRQRMGPWARPDDRIDRPGLFGQNNPLARKRAMQGVGIVAIIMAVLIVVVGLAGGFGS